MLNRNLDFFPYHKDLTKPPKNLILLRIKSNDDTIVYTGL